MVGAAASEMRGFFAALRMTGRGKQKAKTKADSSAALRNDKQKGSIGFPSGMTNKKDKYRDSGSARMTT